MEEMDGIPPQTVLSTLQQLISSIQLIPHNPQITLTDQVHTPIIKLIILLDQFPNF